MKLFLVTASLQGGGAARVLVNMANYWALAGHDVALASYDAPDVLPFYEVDRAVTLLGLGRAMQSPTLCEKVSNNVKRLTAIRRAAVTVQPDAVVSFGDVTNVQVLMALLFSGFPTIVSERTSPGYEPIKYVWNVLRRALYRRADAVVVQTEEAGSFFDGWGLKKLITIPNPVLKNQGLGSSPTIGQPSFVAAGRLSVEKNYELMLRSFAKVVVDGRDDWKLNVAGVGAELDKLQDLVKDLSLEGKVSFIGQVENMASFYEQGTVFVMSSTYEGFPNSLCEAMAAGLPCIVTDCPYGPRAIISHRYNGMLVKNNHVDSLAAAMAELADDAELRRFLGSNAPTVLETYGEDSVMRIWEAVIEGVSGSGGRAEK